ncbi:MAG: hypothetical protein AT715_01305 [Thermoproteus sp. JCHS_4]|nr:MAG: hypothetical protein AT715_01305 [Thermoproteus sp. JCHS_4]
MPQVRLRPSGGVAMCPSCGFAMPGLDICELTGTCVECARKSLGDACARCPEKARCDSALEGLRFVKSLEPRLDVFVDVSRRVVSKAEKYGRVDVAVAFMKSLMGLVKALREAPPNVAFPAWVAAVLRRDAVAKLARTPYVFAGDFYEEFRWFCAEFGCRGLEAPLSNLLASILSLSLIEGVADPSRYFNYV